MKELIIEMYTNMMDLCNEVLKQDPGNDVLRTKVKNYEQKYQEFINYKN
jgi:hypothetical protein